MINEFRGIRYPSFSPNGIPLTNANTNLHRRDNVLLSASPTTVGKRKIRKRNIKKEREKENEREGRKNYKSIENIKRNKKNERDNTRTKARSNERGCKES